MNLFAVLFAVLAVSAVAKAHNGGGLANLLGPLLFDLQPLLSGLNGGIQKGVVKVGKAVNQIGNAEQDTLYGVGSIAKGALPGVGGTLACLPKGVDSTLHNLQAPGSDGIVGKVLDTATGGENHSHSHSDSD